jgi:hypothetical protein
MLYLGGLFLFAIAAVLAVFRAPSRAAQRYSSALPLLQLQRAQNCL